MPGFVDKAVMKLEQHIQETPPDLRKGRRLSPSARLAITIAGCAVIYFTPLRIVLWMLPRPLQHYLLPPPNLVDTWGLYDGYGDYGWKDRIHTIQFRGDGTGQIIEPVHDTVTPFRWKLKKDELTLSGGVDLTFIVYVNPGGPGQGTLLAMRRKGTTDDRSCGWYSGGDGQNTVTYSVGDLDRVRHGDARQ